MEKKYVKRVKKSYEEIDFANRFEDILTHTDFKNRLTKIDKKEILGILEQLGYSFKVLNPGREFVLEEPYEDFKFVFSFNVNGGIVLSYIYVYHLGSKIPYEYPSLVFNYKYFKGDLEMLMEPSTVFVDYSEFETIILDLLKIYEDFKVSFLRLLAE